MAANGYIGKISAVVTANTSDLSRKLNDATTNVTTFANKLSSSLRRSSDSATASIERIFTPLQQLERRLKTGLELNLRTGSEAAAIRAITQVAEQLNRPLERAQKQFSALSLEAASGFAPALQRVQAAVVAVNNETAQTGRIAAQSFSAATAEVQRTVQAISRLTQAQQLAGQGLTGNELQFADPRLFQTLQANARTTAAAGALPASRLESGDIARQIQQLKQYENAAIEARATVENLRLDPQVNPEVILAAERRLQQLTETARRAGQAVARAVNVDDETALLIRREQGGRDAEAARLARQDFTVRQAAAQSSGLGLFGSQGGTAEQRALTSARNLSAQFARLPESAQQGLSGLAGIAANLANRVDQGRASAEQLEAVLARLQARIEAASPAAAIARANEQLALVSDQPPPPPPRTDLGGLLQQRGLERVTGLTGSPNIDSNDRFGPQARRDIDALASRVGNVRQQLETLPNSVRTRFIPELQRALVQLVRLRNAPNATAKAIENAARRVERLEASARRAQAALNFRKSFGGAGLRGIEEGLNQQALQGYNAQLQLLQQTLAGTSQAARGPAVAAFNNLRNAIAKAMKNGTLETEKTSRVIKRLTERAVRATAAAAGIGAAGLGARLKRVGDIGRGAFGNLGLGVQQAVFAIDDFFSVTGGLDQRIRAAGNNISQLGFVLGGTAGLIGGVAVSIGAQLVVALINWANAGRTTEDQVKSLNDALARQKSLVEELAQAFASLGDSIARKAFSAPAQEARDFRRELEQIRAKQEELRDQRSFSLDEGVLRARADVSVAERRLQGASTRDAAVDAQRQLAAARARLADEENRVRNRPELTPQNVRDSADSVFRERALDSAREAGFRAQMAAAATGDGTDAAAAYQAAFNAELQRFAEIRERARASLAGIDDPTAQINALRELQQAPGVRGDERLVAQLEQLIDSIERNAVRRAGDELVIKILEASNRAAEDIRDAQARVAAAIEAGVPAAATLQIALDKVAEEVDASQRRIAKAQQDFAASSQSPADVTRRDAEVNAAKAQLDAARANAEATIEQSRAIDIARQAIDRFAEALSRASQEAQSNLQQAQQRADETRRQDLGFSTPATRQAREQADADLGRQQELASGVEQEAAAARERFAQRVRETQDVRRRGELAAEARRRGREGNRRAAAAGIVPSTFQDNAEEARRGGNDELADFLEETGSFVAQAARELGLPVANPWAGVREAIDAYEAIVNDAATETERALARIAEIDAQLGSVGVLAPGRREELVRERAALEQQAVELDADVRRARDESTREAEQASAAERGRQLSMTPGERAAEDLNRGLEDIRQFFGRQAEETTGLVDFDGQREAQQRLIQESQRSIAPAIFSLFDSVRNAVAAGPSRAALTASDISTSEGARELNRLIRGDDAARDVNLIELQEQTRLLRELVEKTDPAAVAN